MTRTIILVGTLAAQLLISAVLVLSVAAAVAILLALIGSAV